MIEPKIDRETLAARVGEVCRFTGDFRLRSGRVASTYFDKYLFEADPELLAAIAAHMVKLVPETTDVVAGLELGGVPVATAISLAAGIPAAFVRKAAKTYGTAKLVEGADVAGRQVLIIEDVITTGGQAAASAAQLRELGASVDAVLCVVDRSGGNHPDLDVLDLCVRRALVRAIARADEAVDEVLYRPAVVKAFDWLPAGGWVTWPSCR